MKPTPTNRPRWPVVGLILAGSALILWGCGHTREVLYPRRKVSPPRTARGRVAAPKLAPVEPADDAIPPPAGRRQPDAPAAIDVPIIDRNN